MTICIDELTIFVVEIALKVILCKYAIILSSKQNGCHFTYDNFICIFMNEMFCILIQTSS